VRGRRVGRILDRQLSRLATTVSRPPGTVAPGVPVREGRRQPPARRRPGVGVDPLAATVGPGDRCDPQAIGPPVDRPLSVGALSGTGTGRGVSGHRPEAEALAADQGMGAPAFPSIEQRPAAGPMLPVDPGDDLVPIPADWGQPPRDAAGGARPDRVWTGSVVTVPRAGGRTRIAGSGNPWRPAAGGTPLDFPIVTAWLRVQGHRLRAGPMRALRWVTGGWAHATEQDGADDAPLALGIDWDSKPTD